MVLKPEGNINTELKYRIMCIGIPSLGEEQMTGMSRPSHPLCEGGFEGLRGNTEWVVAGQIRLVKL